MKNAQTAAPKVCRCGSRLHKPVYGYTTQTREAYHDGKRYHIVCECGIIHVWVGTKTGSAYREYVSNPIAYVARQLRKHVL